MTYGTCFFEEYAQILLCALLGREYECLVNRDRPDLQSKDDTHLGIEVTRAMEESKKAQDDLLKDISGVTETPEREELDQIVENGYAYGLQDGKYIGAKELPYWSMALPLKRIIESKVSKMNNGLYGHFDMLGLFVFCRDNIEERDAMKAMEYTRDIQKDLELHYDRLYLADVNDLFVLNLEDGIKDAYRMCSYPITQEQRKDFYDQAVQRMNERAEK